MMLSIEDVKDLVMFARQQKVKVLQIGDVKLEMSDYAFIEDVTKEASIEAKKDDADPKIWVDEKEEMDPKEYDELLFHSSNS